MGTIIGVMFIAAFFGTALWKLNICEALKKPCGGKNGSKYITALIIIGFAVRIIAAVSYRGHATDMNCFIGWSDDVFKNGISQFYISDGFHDYPPGYVYVMYILGAIKNLFNLQGEKLWLLIKMPAIICDMIICYMVYRESAKRHSVSAAAGISALLIFNPALILNSAVWGQVDSVLSLFCLLAVYLASQKRLIPSFLAFGAAILIKPQAAFFAPVIIFAVAEELFMQDNIKKDKIIKTALGAVGAVGAVFVLFMPFGENPLQGIKVVTEQYINTMGQYNYMTVNAFNLYGALGKNWADLTSFASVIGYAFIFITIIFSGYVFFNKKGQDRYFISAFILVFGVYMLSVKMHERYAFPAIIMLIFVLLYKPDTKNFVFYCLVTLSQFINTAWVLFIYEKDPNVYYKSPLIIAVSVINLIIFGAYVYLTVKEGQGIPKKAVKNNIADNSHTEKHFRRSEKAQKIVIADIIIIAVMTLAYAGIAFYKLGDRYAPQTNAEIFGDEIRVDFGEEKEIGATSFFLGARQLEENRNLEFKYLDQSGEMVYNDTVTEGDVFSWTVREDVNASARYVVISSNGRGSYNDPTDKIYLNEVCFTDNDGNIIEPETVQGDNAEMLFDEQDYLNMEKSYMSGTYFDEIYHPRTAYEFIHHMSVYEWTHPPLGKVLIGIGILIFGMVPFGWRFIGTLFGVFMVPVVYLFAKRMLKYRWLAVVTSILFVFDFMHFTQTRLATIDTYVTLFIMVMYYYMYKYYKMSYYDTTLKKTLVPLGLSGIFFGLSVASKWTGAYAGAGLAIIFFKTVYERYTEYKYALESPNGETDGILHKTVIDTFRKNTIITLIFCVGAFVIVPILIYALSYIPYFDTPSSEGIRTIIENGRDMYIYHSKTVADSTHPYSSNWYEWPIIYRPLWYFSNTLDSGLKQGISAFGNPAVWWIGIGAVAYNLALAIILPLKKKNYFGINKYNYAGIYVIIWTVLCGICAIAEQANERLDRLFACMLLYSIVMAGMFIIVLMNDDKLKKASSRTSAFLLIGYFSSYLPWTLVVRTTYIYHYFPCVIFAVLMIGYSIKTFYDNAVNKKAVRKWAIVYAVIAVALFALFYPVLSGQPISLEFAEKWLKWFDSWVLVA